MMLFLTQQTVHLTTVSIFMVMFRHSPNLFKVRESLWSGLTEKNVITHCAKLTLDKTMIFL